MVTDDSRPGPQAGPEETSLPEPTKSQLKPRQRDDYAHFRARVRQWLSTAGKDPERGRGLASKTVDNYLARIDRFLRWVWTEFDGYTTSVRPEHADAYVEALLTDDLAKENGEPYAGATKRKHVDAVSKLFDWQATDRGGPDWETDVTFDERRTTHADALSIGERQALREAALEYDSLPSYGDVTPDQRDTWTAYLAQKLGKPKPEVGPADWERVASWKLPSLVWAALDAGLRPVEVERSTLGWLRLSKGALFVPKDQPAKNRDHWEVALQPRSIKALERWCEQRERYEKYTDRDAIWLNQRANPYTSGPLNDLLDNLLEEAGIDTTNRQLTWYSIRHSVGTHMAAKGELDQAREQLRHKSLESTLQYTHPSVEERQDTLGDIG